jgi:light-regulated signal transduction histidine kinase (bacteriophytochrome)
MSGAEMVASIQGLPEVRHVPVLMLTAKADDESRLAMLEAGAQDYLTKPFLPQELRARAANLVAMKLAREAETAARRRAENSSRELEAFSYSVSHDLRAPLRAIDGFSRILAAKPGDSRAPGARELLERVRTAAAKMNQLIEDLLELARVSHGQLERTRFDLSEVARASIRALRESQPDRGAEFTVEEGLIADGDPRFLQVVLDNLLGNAFKFTGKAAVARIAFGARREKGALAFFVKDNGAGFDMLYADKLFGTFQRLHSTQEFEGSGIGLATVQRIIHRHGGLIWAESEPGKGATFFFTLG